MSHAMQFVKVRIECVRTDNGGEFTKHYQKRKTEANTISGSVGSERNTAQTHQSIYPEI